jgi:hypothetical protein
LYQFKIWRRDDSVVAGYLSITIILYSNCIGPSFKLEPVVGCRDAIPHYWLCIPVKVLLGKPYCALGPYLPYKSLIITIIGFLKRLLFVSDNKSHPS